MTRHLPLVLGACGLFLAHCDDTGWSDFSNRSNGSGAADASTSTGPSQDAGEAGDAAAPVGGGGNDAGGTGPGSDAGEEAGVDAGPAPEKAGIFVAVGDGGRRIRSTDDGKTWIDDVSIANGGDDTIGLRTVTWGNGLFVAGAWRIMTSPDGKTWQDTPPDQFNQNWMGALAYGGGSFVGVGGYGSRVTSPDAKTWTQHSIDTAASHSHGGLAYAAGKGFVAVNDDGKVSTSPDGVTWTYGGTTIGTSSTNVVYGNGVFVAIGGTTAAASADGKAWTSKPFAEQNAVLVFAQGHFTAIGREHVYTSNDGAAWTDHPVTGLFAGAVAYGHGTYVAIDNTTARRSTDGLTWSAAIPLGGTNALGWIAFGPQ